MRIAVIGAGPAGLYFALLMKRLSPQIEVDVVEQNPPGATFGFGVVFSDRALEFLEKSDPQMHSALTARIERWDDITIRHRGEAVPIDGNGYSAIGRLEILKLLGEYCENAQIPISFSRQIENLKELSDFDVIVGADGVNSLVRRTLETQFKTQLYHLSNKFVWYGADKPFDTLTLSFSEFEEGFYVAHYYRYSPDKSTFIVECDAATWERAGFGDMSDDESRRYCEKIFADDLGGARLISNNSIWRNFPVIANQNWSAGNAVLIGDALKSAHFSIGSGTRFAFEDAISLAEGFVRHPDDYHRAFQFFEESRRPVAEKLLAAAAESYNWYEDFPDVMGLTPHGLAYNYIKRSGRVSDDKLAEMAPRFVSELSEKLPDRQDAIETQNIINPEPDPRLADEINFRLPDLYNASTILFDNLNHGRGDHVALYCNDDQVTYAALCAKAERAGVGLSALGLKKGDRVIFFLDDTPVYPIAFFGALLHGFVPVLVNTSSPEDMVRYFVKDSGARAVIADPRYLHLFSETTLCEARINAIIVNSGEVTETLSVEMMRYITWPELLSFSLPDETAPETRRDDVAFWMYSSGTTGRPKAAVHLHHDLAYANAAYANNVLKIEADDILYSPPKIFFAYGLGNSLVFPFSVGASAVLEPGRPTPEKVLELLEKHRVTMLFGLPTLYRAIQAFDRKHDFDLSSLRKCLSAAEPLSPELFEAWREFTGLPILEGLGSTEMTHIYLSNTEDACRPGSSGRRVPGYNLKLVDPDGTEIETDNVSGVMMVEGDSSSPCYWRRPEKTAQTMRDSWIYTGDRFRFDQDGFYFFEGRDDDLVKVSGQWVHPMEIERVLDAHPHIQECAVLAVEDCDRLKRIRAYVKLTDVGVAAGVDQSAVQQHAKEKLQPFKYPRDVIFMDALPKTGTDKIDRQALKAMKVES